MKKSMIVSPESSQRGTPPMNQFIATAVSEKLAALSTADYLSQRANSASREQFLQALSRVPDSAPAQAADFGAEGC
jgi:hypothetical protein